MRLAYEGKKILYFILIAFLLLLFLAIFDKIHPTIVFPAFLALIFCINFFRDPQRIIPIGDNQIIARAHNFTERLNDVTAHAEMQAFTAAADSFGGKY